MLRDILHILHGAVLWHVLRIRFHVNGRNRKIVIFLMGDNLKLDYYALVHLKDFMERKYAEGAILFLEDKREVWLAKQVKLPAGVRLCRYPARKVQSLYDYYSFHKFSDKILFTYTDRPKGNELGRILGETEIREEEAVCLGLYRLRTVPGGKKQIKG